MADSTVYMAYASSFQHKITYANSHTYRCFKAPYMPDRVQSSALMTGFGVNSTSRMVTFTTDGWNTLDTVARLEPTSGSILGVGYVFSNGTRWYASGVIQREQQPDDHVNRSLAIWRLGTEGNPEIFRTADFSTMSGHSLRGSSLSMIVTSNKGANKGRSMLVTADLETGSYTVWIAPSDRDGDHVLFAVPFEHGGFLVGKVDGTVGVLSSPLGEIRRLNIPVELPGLSYAEAALINDSTAILTTGLPVSSVSIVKIAHPVSSISQDDPYRGLRLVDITSITPNPASDIANVLFTIASGLPLDEARWELVNARGENSGSGFVVETAQNTSSAGQWRLGIDVSSLPSGVYSLTIRVRGYGARKSIVVVR
jgi:hypothetical protein